MAATRWRRQPHLAYAGAQVSILHFDAPGTQSDERAAALQRARASDARFVDLDPATLAATEWNLVVDGLFGIGLKRPLEGTARQLVEAVNQLRCAILALDVPSGLDADTGAIVGPEGVAVRATHTATFIGDKPGLHTCDGRDHAGVVEVCRLDLDSQLFAPSRLHLNDVKFFSRHLQARRHNSHKGSYGNVAVIGGAHGMSGAPVLASRAALFCGAGRVYALFAEHAPAYDSMHAELMCRLASDFDFNSATLVIGPGLGNSRQSLDLLSRAIASDSLLLADADALNLLAAEAALQTALRQRAQPGDPDAASTGSGPATGLHHRRGTGRPAWLGAQAGHAIPGLCDSQRLRQRDCRARRRRRHQHHRQRGPGHGRYRRRAVRAVRRAAGAEMATVGSGAGRRVAAWDGGGRAGHRRPRSDRPDRRRADTGDPRGPEPDGPASRALITRCGPPRS